MTQIKQFVFNELGVNSFVLYDDSNQCALVDPGCNTPAQEKQLTDFLRGNSLEPTAIFLTHGHFDHVAGLAWARETFDCPIYMHPGDEFLVKRATEQAQFFGFTMPDPPMPDKTVNDGDVIAFGLSEVTVLHVPGHSPGSICLHLPSDRLLVCGDVLFQGSIGRTDLYGGDHDLLIRGIREKLMVLPRETLVWPGHGPKTTIGFEYDTNPFLN
jgi:hydroxyacylglutathione hydrolase